MFKYNICNQYDREIFQKQVDALLKHIPDCEQKEIIEDVDSSQIGIIQHNENIIKVFHQLLYWSHLD